MSSPFQTSDLVMDALQRTLDQFFKSEGRKEKDAKLKGLWKKKQTIESQMEQRMKQSVPQSLDDVKMLVLGMADEWKGNHGKVCEFHHETLPEIKQLVDLSYFQPDLSHFGCSQHSFQDGPQSKHVRGRLGRRFIHDCAGESSYIISCISKRLIS